MQMNLNPLDWLLNPSTAKIAAAKQEIQTNTDLGKVNPAGGMDLAHQIAMHLLLLQDAKSRNPLLGDMPVATSGAGAPAPPIPDQGGIWADAEDEKKKRAQAGGLRAPVLESLGLIPKPKAQ